MKKVLAISSVLLGVVFLAGCGQRPVSQTQPTTLAPVAQTPGQPADETASWKTYSNTKYGFEIKYPTDWTARIEEDQPAISFFHDQSAYGGVNLVLNELGNNSLEKWYESFYSKAISDAKKANEPINISDPKTFKITTFNGYSAIESNNQFAFDHSVTIIYFSIGKNIFLVSYPDSNANDPDFNNNYQVFKKIFSTFKLTK